MASRLLLVTPQPAFAQRVSDTFVDDPEHELSTWWGTLNGDRHTAVRRLVDGSDAVAVGPGIEALSAIKLAELIDEVRPDVSVVVVAERSPEVLDAALRAGVRDVVAPDAPGSRVHDALVHALDTARRRRQAFGSSPDDACNATRVVSVLSPKGGTGKTTLSTNLAVGLALDGPSDVVIVDLDLQFGDVAHALRLSPEHTFTDAARLEDDLDLTTLKLLLTCHPRGFYSLCAPASPGDADDFEPRHVKRVLELLAQEFRYVVCDTGSGMDEATLAALELSNDVVLVASTDVPSVRATQKQAQILDVLGRPDLRRHFVLNRADARAGLSVSDIEATVGLRVDVSIPSSRAVPLSLNQGSPLLESDPRSPVARSLFELVNRFAGRPVSNATPSGGGLFRRRSA